LHDSLPKESTMTAFRQILLGATVLTLVVGTAEPTPAQAPREGRVADSDAIRTQVSSRLAADRVADTAMLGVSVNEGVVTLTGTVDSTERQTRALEIAKGVEGVRAVVDNILVRESTAGSALPRASVTRP
jgi:hypothetical protein